MTNNGSLWRVAAPNLNNVHHHRTTNPFGTVVIVAVPRYPTNTPPAPHNYAQLQQKLAVRWHGYAECYTRRCGQQERAAGAIGSRTDREKPNIQDYFPGLTYKTSRDYEQQERAHLGLEGEGGVVELQPLEGFSKALVVVRIHGEQPAEHLQRRCSGSRIDTEPG